MLTVSRIYEQLLFSMCSVGYLVLFDDMGDVQQQPVPRSTYVQCGVGGKKGEGTSV